jgi:A/G-specific adenine glycosylase
VENFARRLLRWYDVSGRHDLPWQQNISPYSVWVSEIMLQQTQVATVVPYYQRFMSRFPTVAALAAAERDEVLAAWSGLGYYARGRNLHAAAKCIVSTNAGVLPDSLDALVALPGIGRSTAAAILALASGQRQAILDGNVKRVLARYHMVSGWPGRAAVSSELWQFAERNTPHERVAHYTQAIMDLGATVCTRVKPDCDNCPLGLDCGARQAGMQTELPTRKPRTNRPQRSVFVLLVRDADQAILLEKRPDAGIWGGLYSLPEISNEDDTQSWCHRYLGAVAINAERAAAIEHAFTHFDLRIEPIVVDLDNRPGQVLDSDSWLWYKPTQPLTIGLAAPIATLIESMH